MVIGALAGHLVLIAALQRLGVHMFNGDLRRLVTFLSMLGLPLFFANQILWLGTNLRCRRGSVVVQIVVLLPLGVIAALE